MIGIIVVKNCWPHLRECINNARASGCCQVLVVDTGAPDDSVEVATQLSCIVRKGPKHAWRGLDHNMDLAFEEAVTLAGGNAQCFALFLQGDEEVYTDMALRDLLDDSELPERPAGMSLRVVTGHGPCRQVRLLRVSEPWKHKGFWICRQGVIEEVPNELSFIVPIHQAPRRTVGTGPGLTRPGADGGHPLSINYLE